MVTNVPTYKNIKEVSSLSNHLSKKVVTYHTFVLEMSIKKLTLILFLSWYCYCQCSIVVDLKDLEEGPTPDNEKTVLSLATNIKIKNSVTFCIRFNLCDTLTTNYFFSEKDNKLGLTLRFSMNQGIIFLNKGDKERLIFKIPKDNNIKPFHWHHICVSSNENAFRVVAEGKLWYHRNHSMKSLNTTNVSQLNIGSNPPSSLFGGGENFKGEISQLNIWSKSLSSIDLMNITKKCEFPKPIPDILNWSNVSRLMIKGKSFKEDIHNLCSHKDSLSTHKVMSGLQDSHGAIHTCKILNGELASPMTLSEKQSGESK